jgi:glycosyltransferase involved in cell wall biosynthesis
MKILFLYTELADYFLKACEALGKHAQVHIIRWPVNKEAPFKFVFPPNTSAYDKNDYEGNKLDELVKSISPGMIVCSGWIDKDYLRLIAQWKGKVPTVLALDTQWKGSVKQQIARVLSRLMITPRFSHAWVPGEPQKKYALKLGFAANTIHTGFYTCDLSRFNNFFRSQAPQKRTSFPHRFIYVGRYYPFKGITDLWHAFSRLTIDERKDWELWCLGAGNIDPAQAPGITHFGFVQPGELEPIIKNTGVFILPSRFEPWAVVVHEFAAAGFPLLLSDAVGAGTAYLQEGKNGSWFPSGDIDALTKLLKKMISLSDKELFLMAESSHSLAQKNGPEEWAQTALDIYNGWHKK